MKNAIASKPSRVQFSRLWWYLLLVIILSAFCYITLNVLLLPYSIAYSETGKMTAGYFLYAAIGLLFSTPTPFVAVLIISLFIEKIGIRQMFRSIFHTENKMKTILITGGFCLLAFVYAILFGTPNGSPWYMFPLGFLIMIPFVGIAEETGWRGLLQPELDKRMLSVFGPSYRRDLVRLAFSRVYRPDIKSLRRQYHRIRDHDLYLGVCSGSPI